MSYRAQRLVAISISLEFSGCGHCSIMAFMGIAQALFLGDAPSLCARSYSPVARLTPPVWVVRIDGRRQGAVVDLLEKIVATTK